MRVLLLTPNWPSSFSKEGHSALNIAELSGMVLFIVQISSENIRACFLCRGCTKIRGVDFCNLFILVSPHFCLPRRGLEIRTFKTKDFHLKKILNSAFP